MLLCYNRRPTATPNVSLFRFIFFCPSFQCFATGFAPLLQFCKHHIFFNTVVDDFDNFSVDVRFDFSHSFNLGQDSFARIGTSTTSHAYFKFGCARHCQVYIGLRSFGVVPWPGTGRRLVPPTGFKFVITRTVLPPLYPPQLTNVRACRCHQ